MDVTLLSQIQHAMAEVAGASTVVVSIIGVIVLNQVAPGAAYSWLKKMLWIALAIGLWNQFVDYNVENAAICEGSVPIYRILPESTFIFAAQVFTFVVTLKLLMWIFDIAHPHDSLKSDSHDKK